MERPLQNRLLMTAPPTWQVSPDCAALLAGLLEAKPAARLTLPQALQHPWLANGLPHKLASLNACLEVCCCCSSAQLRACNWRGFEAKNLLHSTTVENKVLGPAACSVPFQLPACTAMLPNITVLQKGMFCRVQGEDASAAARMTPPAWDAAVDAASR